MNKRLVDFNIICKFAHKEFKQNGKTETFDNYANTVIKNGRPDENYFFARDVAGADPIAHGKVVLDSKDGEFNYLFGLEVYGCDHKAHINLLYSIGETKLAKKLEYEHTPICEL